MEELCHCGKPLHYKHKATQESMEKLVREKGRYVEIVSHINNKTYKADRHYIALHGLKGKDVPFVGFEEVTNERQI